MTKTKRDRCGDVPVDQHNPSDPKCRYAPAGTDPRHYGLDPCHRQPGRQQWHLSCALRHPIRFLRTRSVIGL